MIRALKLKDEQVRKLHEFEVLDGLQWFIEVVSLGTGQSFGELALINDAPRAATIACHKECYFAVIGRQEYQRVLKKIEWKAVQLKIDFFLNLPFLSHWTRHQINKFIYSFSEQAFQRNQTVFHQGDNLNMIYIVKSGEFEQFRYRKYVK
jgi:CRP-like cAMP-binding protein